MLRITATTLLGCLMALLVSKMSQTTNDSSKINFTRADDTEVIQDYNSLEGTWQLMAAKLAHTAAGEPAKFESDAGIVALKIFTRNRFLTLRYDKETHTLLGTCGVTYIQLGDQFTEYIDFR